MSIIAKGDGSTFIPAPEGQFQAVCCDVVDLGIMKSEWQGKVSEKHRIRIVHQLDELMDDGKPFLVSRTFTLTLNEMGHLRPFLESWRGKAFTPAEVTEGFDVEKLIGVNAVVQIVHNPKGERIYANIQSIMKTMKGMKPLTVTPDYVRMKDRTTGNGSGPSDEGAPAHEDDDLPF